MDNRVPTNDELQKETARRLNQLFKNRKISDGWTQDHVRKQMGFSHQTLVSRYMLGKVPMGLEVVARFAKVFGVDPSEIRPDFYDALHLTPSTVMQHAKQEVQVITSISGVTPEVGVIETTINEGIAVKRYAVLVDTPMYRNCRIKEGSHLIVGVGLKTKRDHDVYVETTSGKKYIAVYLGPNEQEKTHIVRDILTDNLIDLPVDEIKVMDVIIGIQNPNIDYELDETALKLVDNIAS